MAVQFTLADGFFNRKRGRPPKNRYVQVYKNLQLPPQAVFTSFKLNRQYAATLTPLLEGLKDNNVEETNLTGMSKTKAEFFQAKNGNFEHFTNSAGKDSTSDGTEVVFRQKPVIRSNGIYFPDQVAQPPLRMCNLKGSSTDQEEDERKCLTAEIGVNPLGQQRISEDALAANFQFTYTYLHLLQLINLYQRTLPPQVSQEEVGNLNTTSLDFSRHTCSEDCGFRACRYRERQTHYHCVHSDCQYGFCEKSRFAQHNTRHKRLDRLLGTDFKQYPTHTNCGYTECVKAKRTTSHFHCLHCAFTCWETHRIAPHRRWHSKLEDFKQKTGFQKILHNAQCTVGESRESSKCVYSGKKTHFHCSICGYSALSKTQIFAHKH